MEGYDPLEAPDAEEWLALDESERIFLVEEHHILAEVELPNRHLHSVIHATVENQLAMGKPPEAQRALARLLADGLDRHDAIHAIGSVLSEHMYNLLKEPKGSVSNEAYSRALDRLTAESWFSSYSDPD